MIVKICGITTISDALAALEDGADWIGLNLVAGPRRIPLSTVEKIVTQLPDPAGVVALVSAGAADLPSTLDRLRTLGVRRLQLYPSGDKINPSPAMPTRFPAKQPGFEVIAVQPVAADATVPQLDTAIRQIESDVSHVLFDAASASKLGGTGRRANWSLLAQAHAAGRFSTWPSVLLAGGLNPDNVAEAIQLVHPAGVDVSSGVEASVGRKDRTRMRDFVSRAKSAGAT